MFSTTEITSHEISSDNVIHQRLYYAYLEAARLIAEAEGGKSVLEIGCGAGRGLDALLEVADRYLALDKNDKLVAKLQAEHPTHAFRSQTIPPFAGVKDDSFDFVCTFQVIEHVQDDRAFLAECHRVLKPGGTLILSTPNKSLSLTRNPWHVREYLAEELSALIRRYFPATQVMGVTGNEKVLRYYEENKASVKRITRFDVLNLQYRLPRQLLQVPYDVLNRLNRNRLQNSNASLVQDVSPADYSLVEDGSEGFDLFAVARKSA